MRNLLLLLASLSFSISAQAGIWEAVTGLLWKQSSSAQPLVNVLIVHDQPSIILEVKGKYQLYDPHENSHISTRFLGKRKAVEAVSGGLKWGEEFPGIHQLKVIPDEPTTVLSVDGVEYPGSLLVYDIGGTISIVNQVPLEKYLEVILAPQFVDPLSEEALAAVAIIARTYAYYQLENPKNPYWTVEGSRVGYQGNGATRSRSLMAKAIKATRGMVLSRAKGKSEKVLAPFAAQWGSGSGGKATGQQHSIFSRITLFEAEEMARKGENAAQILAKAFPNATIELIK
ncbi:SpoIID/LytB domain-containing protein [Parachlamydia sp. AcF125]|uniref:SpoIID/LytB domain-containing protein n=1 Tax=Parachlamydia sp. AcF125 TaxID=2795736 RepID=UPI0020165472|nr:SpoIID/LytB domain-containing protein [Parachlamydia sp. AcF125]